MRDGLSAEVINGGSHAGNRLACQERPKMLSYGPGPFMSMILIDIVHVYICICNICIYSML